MKQVYTGEDMIKKTLLRIKNDVAYASDGFYWLILAFLCTLWAGWQFGWTRVYHFYSVVFFTTPVIIATAILCIINKAYEKYYPKKISTGRMLREQRRRADILEKEAYFKNTYIRTLKKEIARLKFLIVKEKKNIHVPFSDYNDEA